MRLPISSRFLKFLMVGGLNTLIGYAVYVLFALTSFPTWLVLILTNAITILVNFCTTGGLIFRDLSLRRLPKFLASYALVLLLYWLLIAWLSPTVGGRIWAMTIVVLPMSLLTYFIQSRFVFD